LRASSSVQPNHRGELVRIAFALSRALKAKIADRKAPPHFAQEKMGSVVPHEREPAREPARRAAKVFGATALVQAARRELRGRVLERDLELARVRGQWLHRFRRLHGPNGFVRAMLPSALDLSTLKRRIAGRSVAASLLKRPSALRRLRKQLWTNALAVSG
jgi:hypothetical protein